MEYTFVHLQVWNTGYINFMLLPWYLSHLIVRKILEANRYDSRALLRVNLIPLAPTPCLEI
jgi:hypothetical protein